MADDADDLLAPIKKRKAELMDELAHAPISEDGTIDIPTVIDRASKLWKVLKEEKDTKKIITVDQMLTQSPKPKEKP